MTNRDFQNLKIDAESLKARFDKPEADLSPGDLALVRRWRSRLDAGLRWNLRHYKLFLGIDRAWEVGFTQATQSLVGLIKDLADAKKNDDAISAVKKWGMTHLLREQYDDKGTVVGQAFDFPAMYAVTLSLARGVTQQRASRLANERLQTPTFKFEPAYLSMENRIKAEVTNQRVSLMDRQFGYSHLVAQAITAACMYGHSLVFPVEEWYSRSTIHDGAERPYLEGLRLGLIHPSRSYYDLDWPIMSLNNDTGARYAGNWRTTTYGNIRSQGYWNLARIKHGNPRTAEDWRLFLQTMTECRMTGATFADQTWFTETDRQRNIDGPYLTEAEEDQPVWVAEHFEKLNLKRDLGGDLPDVDLWFRITLGNDATPLYVAPLPHRPVTAFALEPVDGRSLFPGIMLDAMSFQDHATNLMEQALITMRQNLANMTLFDEDIIDPAVVNKEIKNPGEKFYRKLNFLGFSGRKLGRQQTSLDRAFYTYKFPITDISQHLVLLEKLLNLMERCLGTSSQEVGAAASHEQSAQEVVTIQNHTAQRVMLQGFYLDLSIEALKSTIYSFLMAFGTSEFYAVIDPKFSEEYLRSLEFNVQSSGPEGHVIVTSKERVYLEHWAERRDGPNRVPWDRIGNQMTQIISAVLANPNLANAVKPAQLVELLNFSLEAAGLPKDFRLDPAAAGETVSPELQKWVMAQLSEFAEQVKGYVARQMNPPVEMPGAVPGAVPAGIPAVPGIPESSGAVPAPATMIL